MLEPQVTILHVDDNEANRYVVTRILKNAGFTVVEAATGAAGLAAIAAHQPALVILDVQLPDASGFEVCRQIKSNPETTFIPVLHLSASFVKSQDKAEGLDSGADAYLAQPVEPIELIATVRSLLRIRQAEEAALSSAREWQTTFDAIHDSVCLVDRQGKLLRCNQAMMRMFCKPSHELLGCAYHELMNAELGVGDGICFRRAQETRQRQGLEFQSQDRWFAKTIDPVFNEQGTFTGAVFILSDITDRKHTEAALRESEELRQRILESSHDCIKVLAIDGRILYINAGGLHLLEIDQPTFILNSEWVSFWQGEDQEKARTAIAAAKVGNAGQFQGYCPTSKGKPKWWDVIVTPVQNALGEVTQLLVVSRDMTKQKLAAAEREQLLAREQAAREQAETANRIKDEFLAVLSHELRSPLNPILGWARILQTSQQDEARTQYALETIERNARLQAQLIEDLLDVSRILQGKLNLNIGPIGLPFTIKAALETVRLAAEAKAIDLRLKIEDCRLKDSKTVAKTIEAPPQSPNLQSAINNQQFQVLGDSARLQQVIWNLLTNAIKFTPNGGQVEVRLEHVEVTNDEGQMTNDASSHFALRTSHFAQITVSDTGKGISPNFLPHVFDYFRQADGTTTRRFGGLGLGLAIVRHLVELHGGTIQAASLGEEQGAKFTVRLPLLKVESRDQRDINASPLTPHSSPLTGLRVLFVDDDRDSREFIAFLLEQHGVIVTEVASASAALERLKQAKFDLLISDIGMPNMDGYTLIHKLREQAPEQSGMIPAIALTAYAAEIDQQKALAAGFQQHITKPIEPEIFMQTIWTLVEQWIQK